MTTISIAAPAKINLALHVTGQRPDGYHLLDTLVVFTEAGDRVTAELAASDVFTLDGPFAGALGGESGDNLVIRARDGLRALLADPAAAPPVHLHLEKNLPVASGIGGGSADAAATLRALLGLWKAEIPDDALLRLALSLGADVPMCLLSKPLIARGIGEQLEPVSLPSLSILLVNPLRPVSTPQIFRLLATKTNPPMPADLPARLPAPIEAIRPLRNDLQPPAEALLPEISEICSEMQAAGAMIARMSGSGATCFGLFSDEKTRDQAADQLRKLHPGWFISATRTLS